MKKLALVPMHQIESLPKWSAPKNLGAAATTISELGRDMHEHAYLIGRTLSWVKKEVGHGKFLAWLSQNVWFGDKTAENMMNFAKRCERAGEIIEYHPRKSVTVTNLPTKKRKQKKFDPRPPESLLFFDIAHRIEESFSSLTQDQKRDFVETMQDLIRQLETRIEESAQ